MPARARAPISPRAPGEPLLRARLGEKPRSRPLEYGEPLTLGGVARVASIPPATSSARRRCASKPAAKSGWSPAITSSSPTPPARPSSPLRCHTFVTESTFGLPIFRWPAEAEVLAAIHAWWRANQEAGKASLLFAYPWARRSACSRRIDASHRPDLRPRRRGAVQCRIYREAGRRPRADYATPASAADRLAPRADPRSAHRAQGSPWLRRFGAVSTALASGWMRIRGTRRRRSLDRGFVLSDHADWPGAAPRHRRDRAPKPSGSPTATARPLVRWLAASRASKPSASRLAAKASSEPRGAGGRAVKAFAELYAALDETTKTNEKVAALTRYSPRRAAGGRRLGRPLPDRPPPQAAAGIAQAGAVGHRRGRHARLAVRRVLPRGGRFRRDHRAAAAARRSLPRRCRCITGWRSACCPCAMPMTKRAAPRWSPPGAKWTNASASPGTSSSPANFAWAFRRAWWCAPWPRSAASTPTSISHRLMGDWQPTAEFWQQTRRAGDRAMPTSAAPILSSWPIRWKAPSRTSATSANGRWNGNGTASARS